MKRLRVGWVLDTSPKRTWALPWDRLSPVAQIRFGGIARHLKNTDEFHMEQYRPWVRYDAVVFVKIMSDAAFELARALKKRGTRVLFDTNVNYYESWGDFVVPGTEPTPVQQNEARRMTESADAVVADSSYLMDLCKKLNPKTTFIPDAVDTDFFRPAARSSAASGPLTLIWSGIGKKAYHLEVIEKLLVDLKSNVRLVLVPSRPTSYDPPAPVLERLQKAMGATLVYWDYRRYRDLLSASDLVISPKHLSSSYEMAHTEYKITLGMAMHLPALASAQRSYIEAIGDGVGGQICATPEEWRTVLERYLSDRHLLEIHGAQARDRVVARYAIPVVAQQYARFLQEVCLS